MSICFGKSWVSHHQRVPDSRQIAQSTITRLGFYAFVVLCLAPSPSLLGQSAAIATEVVPPTAIGKAGQVDSSALNQINQHLLAVGNVAWTGMQGTGQITYGADKASNPASLTILGDHSFRLDVQGAKGMQSMRIDGKLGKMQGADGRTDPLSPDTASTGLVQFPLLRSVDFTSRSVSLIDQGLASVDGLKLHRLTMESGFITAKTGAPKPKTTVTDFYFDPKTNLLVKSANTIRLTGSGSNQIRVTTYEDYRQVSGSMIPFRLTQSLDGQVLWTLQLTDAQPSTDKQKAYFEF